MRSVARWGSVPLAVAALVWLVSVLLARVPLARRLEWLTYDARVALRNRVDKTSVPISPAIRLVLVDQVSYDRLLDPESSDRLHQHPVYWLPYYATVMSGVLGGGARVVGLDFVPELYDDKLFEKFGTVAAAWPDRIVLASVAEREPLTNRLEVLDPPAPLVAIVTADNMGLVNITRDADGVARAQLLGAHQLPVHAARVAPHNETRSYFDTVLLERFSGQDISPTQGGTRWGSRFIPGIAPDDPRVLINYVGQPGMPFRSYSFEQVLSASQRAEGRGVAAVAARAWLHANFDGSLVIIGPGASRDQDLAITPTTTFGVVQDPYTGRATASMLGVEVHANLLNTVLTGHFLRRASRGWQMAMLAVMCLLFALLAYHCTVGGAFNLGLLALLAWLVGSYELLARAGLWVPVVSVCMACPLVFAATYAWKNLFEEAEIRKVRQLFARSVSPDVMEELIADPQKAAVGATERRTVTVLFSDINGFTTVSETRDPSEVMQMLNHYFEEMTAIIYQARGTIKQFVGDEIMVMFGAPRPHPSPEEAAVRTAVRMIMRLDELRAQDPTGQNGFYSIKIGIHTGEVIVGNVGSADRSEYAAVGDDVNLGSRIMNMTKQFGCNILISEATYEKVKNLPEVRFIAHGDVAVRGRKEKVHIYEIQPAALPEVKVL